MPKKNTSPKTSSTEERKSSLPVDDTSPPLPGVILRGQYLRPSRTTLTDFARHIGVSRRTISMIVNGSRPMTVDTASRFSRALGTSAQFWLDLQRDVDIWNAVRENGAEYDRIEPLPTKQSTSSDDSASE